MGKTFDENKYKSYTEFFAFNKTLGGDIDNLRDSDDGSPLLQKYNASKPPDGWFRRCWENGNLRYEWYYKDGNQDEDAKDQINLEMQKMNAIIIMEYYMDH